MQALKYRIYNWPEYNKALVARGDISFWIDENAIAKWLSVSSTGEAGRPVTYSDDAILMLLIVREVFKLPLRALEGFVRSLFRQMDIDLPVPCYSQISRRAKTLHKRVGKLMRKEVKHIIFDSTGLKVYGEGEWKVRIHGKSKRRTWRKLHIGIDAQTQEIVVCELTDKRGGDAKVAEKMLDKVGNKLKTVRGDGSYDAGRLRAKAHKMGAKVIVPPPVNAVYKNAQEGWQRERDATLAEIKGLGGGEDGLRIWKVLTRYHRRSLVETTMYRIKQLIGGTLKARCMECQRTEAYCKCLVINKMNKLGMPKGEWILEAA
jgi:hypothetical protein